MLSGCVLFAISCGGDAGEEASQGFEIEKHYENGPVAVTMKVSRQQITVADRIEVVLEAVADEGQKVELPSLKRRWGEFEVADSRSERPQLVGEGRVLTRKSYQLEPFLPGEYMIPPFEIHFSEEGAEEPEGQVVETEEIPIEVKSVLPETAEEPDIKEIVPPVDMPGLGRWWVIALVAAGLLALAALAYFWWRRRRGAGPAVERPLLPHEVAYRELENLLADDLLARGQPKLFYLRLSNILRHYIEDRFGLRAPESTTEEFLVDLRSYDGFAAVQKQLLQAFLGHCDMVKFAEYQPSRDEIEQSVGTCRQFVDATRTRPEDERAGGSTADVSAAPPQVAK